MRVGPGNGRGLAAALLLGGCAGPAGAPSVELFGAFFPGWMLCATLGLVAAFAARAVFVATGLAARLPFQFFLCTAIGLLCGLLSWTLSFGS